MDIDHLSARPAGYARNDAGGTYSPPAPYLRPGSGDAASIPSGPPPSSQRERMLAVISRHGSATVAKIAEEMGISRQNADAALRKMRDQGKAVRDGSTSPATWRLPANTEDRDHADQSTRDGNDGLPTLRAEVNPVGADHGRTGAGSPPDGLPVPSVPVLLAAGAGPASDHGPDGDPGADAGGADLRHDQIIEALRRTAAAVAAAKSIRDLKIKIDTLRALAGILDEEIAAVLLAIVRDYDLLAGRVEVSHD